MTINIFSVPHTGTFFTEDLLRRFTSEYLHIAHWHGVEDITGLTVSPLRSPQKVWRSWCTRNAIPGEMHDSYFKEFIANFEALNHAYETKEDLIIFPIDVDREDHLANLTEKLNLPLETDWTPCNHQEPKNYIFTDLSYVYNLPVIKAFY